MSSDLRELDALIDDVRHIPAEVGRQAHNIVLDSSVNILREWQMRWSGHRDIVHLPRAITVERHDRDGVFTAEIGPENRRSQGPLGRIIELGTHTSAPIPGGFPALDAEEPHFIHQVETITILGVKGD